MTITIEPWLIEGLKAIAYFSIGWVAGAFMRWLNKETRN